MMTDIEKRASAKLYDQIRLEIKRCNKLGIRFATPGPDLEEQPRRQEDVFWRPKSELLSFMREEIKIDPHIAVNAIRFMGKTRLYVKFELKQVNLGPIRVQIILNGCHTIRVSIATGKIKNKRTRAEVLLDIEQFVLARRRELNVEIVKDNLLISCESLTIRCKPVWSQIAYGVFWAKRLFQVPFLSSLHIRSSYVPATRLLEDSVRITLE